METAAPASSAPAANPSRFSADELSRFENEGYLIARGMADAPLVEALLDITRRGLAAATGPGTTPGTAPVEYEADLMYPGAPASRRTEGGDTIRRLKEAQARDPLLTSLVSQPSLVGRLQQLLGGRVVMPLAHHNCIMTKNPRYSSETGWHQDIRYWSFERPELVSVWLALGEERPENGGLYVIPGTHRMSFDRSRLDEALFLRPDLPENAALIAQKRPVLLDAGDLLFFHCRTFHAADRNRTARPKFSVVFTFRALDNAPRAGTRSASMPELLLPWVGQ